MGKLFIVHETNNLDSIMKTGIKTTSKNISRAQGSDRRERTDDPTLLLNYRKNDKVLFDEVDAVYCRIFKSLENIKTSSSKGSLVVLKPSVLENFKWHFNTTENNGFYIKSFSPFSGESGKTIFSLKEIHELDFDENDAELVIMDDVPKNYICMVIKK
jgi:hypothetical protein